MSVFKKQVRYEYLVQVQIIEARNLQSKDGSGSCDPFVKINVGNLAPQVTTTKIAATTAVFNQSFTFPNLMMNAVEFESFEIKIEVLDFNSFGMNQLVGQYSIGLSTLFRNPSHEIYNTWLPLTHPKEGLEPQGFLLVSAYIISANDRPPVHDINENNIDEEADEFDGKPDDQLTGEELQRRREKKYAIALVSKPQYKGKSYQLMVNIVKAEDLPIMSFGKIDSFISVRAGGYTQITPVMKSQTKPQYSTRLMFPLYFPVFNDKIVIRVWDKRICRSDTYIAMIPEIPTENDFFNINFLQSRGGVMPFRWFNLYGIPMDERPSNFEEFFQGYKKQMIGTDYMGRVLMSLNLTPSEKPEKLVVPLSTFREPEIIKYICRVDVYEVQEAKDCGQNVQIRVKIGSVNILSTPGRIKKIKSGSKSKKQISEEQKKDKNSKSYEWTDKLIQLEDEMVELPADGVQIPDMVVSLQNEEGLRVAYFRIPYTSGDLQEPDPKWYTFKAVKTKEAEGRGVTHSFILANFMLRPENQVKMVPRIRVKRDIPATYILHAYMYGGYDFCPDCYSEEVIVDWELKIASQRINLGSKICGKNPIWNQIFKKRVQVEERLEFASNIIITFQNNHPSKKGGWFSDNRIGEICIPAISCKMDSLNLDWKTFEPNYQFYHVQTSGSSGGRILAAFHLQKLSQTQMKEDPPPEREDLIKNFTPFILQFPVMGIRKLPTIFQDPIMNIRIPIPQQKAILLFNVLDQEDQTQSQQNDNPYYNYQTLQITEKQKKESASNWFGSGIKDPNFLQVAELQVYLPDDLKFYPCLEIELRDKTNKNDRYISSISLIRQVPKSFNQTNLSIAQAIKFFENGKRLEKDEDEEEQNKKDEMKEKEENKKKEEEKEKEKESIKKQKLSKKSKNTNSNQNQNQEKESLINQEEQQSDALGQGENKIKKELQSRNVCNVEVGEVLVITKHDDDVKELKQESESKIEKLIKFIKALPKNEKGVEQIKGHVNRLIEQLRKQVDVKENDFYGISEDADDNKFDYGREVYKGSYDDKIAKNIPYKKYPLFQLTKTSHGIIGNATNGIIKGNLRLVSQVKSLKSKSKTISNLKKSSKKSEKKYQCKFDKEKIQKSNYAFDIFDQSFMQFFEKSYRLKVRVYIYRCMNLAAQTSNIDTHQMLAGMQAICSANPYPEIIIGESKKEKSDLVKYVNDQDRYMENTLFPGFYRIYELDAELPRDWKLTLNIKNKGMIDNVIGSVEIDMEDRLLGEQFLKERISFQVYKIMFEQELDELKYNYEPETEQIKNWLKGEITNLTQKIDNFDKNTQIPVEYKQLNNEGNKTQTSQGSIEMFVEVFPIEVARAIQPSKLEAPRPQMYEVRFIILETFNIPKIPPKKSTNIQVRASMDASATGNDQEVSKQTDIHMSCQDGNGVFNWRMKFPLVNPSTFPRIKLQVYDTSQFSSDESIGETTISLRRILSKLDTDGKYEMPPTKIVIKHPSFPDQDRGEVLIQMNVVTQQFAEAEPVGEAQEEPNINPYLVKPTVGRGLADMLGMTGGGSNFMLYLKIAGGVIVSLLIIVVLFVKPGILVN